MEETFIKHSTVTVQTRDIPSGKLARDSINSTSYRTKIERLQLSDFFGMTLIYRLSADSKIFKSCQ